MMSKCTATSDKVRQRLFRDARTAVRPATTGKEIAPPVGCFTLAHCGLALAADILGPKQKPGSIDETPIIVAFNAVVAWRGLGKALQARGEARQ